MKQFRLLFIVLAAVVGLFLIWSAVRNARVMNGGSVAREKTGHDSAELNAQAKDRREHPEKYQGQPDPTSIPGSY